MSAFQETVESSDEESPVQDADACNDAQLAKLFQQQVHLVTEECVSLKKSYILNLAASQSWDTIAAGTSTKSVHVFKLSNNGLTRTTNNELDKLPNGVVGVRFANTDPNVLYVGTADGTIFTYDQRQNVLAMKMKASKPITCLDLNANDRVVCAGTEQIGQDSYLLFLDVRKQTESGGYWESHSEDICSVRFHPSNPDRLASGSTDGLINVFDLSQSSEDDALEHCMNTESSVQKLNWHQSDVDRDLLSCITHVNDLHLYDVNETEQVFRQDRDAITKHIQRTSSIDCNVINVHSTSTAGRLLVLSGSNYNKGECLRSLYVDRQKEVLPATNFTGNKQVVRTSLYNSNDQLTVTGGEGGLITLWSPGPSTGLPKTEFKEKTKDKNRKHKAKPY